MYINSLLYIFTYKNMPRSGQKRPSAVPPLVQKFTVVAGRDPPLAAELVGRKKTLFDPSKDGFYGYVIQRRHFRRGQKGFGVVVGITLRCSGLHVFRHLFVGSEIQMPRRARERGQDRSTPWRWLVSFSLLADLSSCAQPFSASLCSP